MGHGLSHRKTALIHPLIDHFTVFPDQVYLLSSGELKTGIGYRQNDPGP